MCSFIFGTYYKMNPDSAGSIFLKQIFYSYLQFHVGLRSKWLTVANSNMSEQEFRCKNSSSCRNHDKAADVRVIDTNIKHARDSRTQLDTKSHKQSE
jgi:hypothetical protein